MSDTAAEGSATRRRFVLVCHEATRTGAVRVALQTLEALPGDQFEKFVVLKEGGPLVADFERAADEVVVKPRKLLTLAGRRAERLGFGARSAAVVPALVLRRWKPHVVWANTIFSSEYIRPALGVGARAVLHAHELGPMVATLVERNRLREVGDGFLPVACSSRGGRELAQALGVGDASIRIIRSAVDVDQLVAQERAGADVEGPDHGDGPAVVLGCGSVNKRKAPDLFLRVAERVLRDGAPGEVRFVWIGAGPDLTAIRQQVVSEGLAHAVDFVGEMANPYPAMARSRLLVLTSRRESFPLVSLEALALGTPVVAFDVGDVRDQLDGCGTVVAEVGDVEAMAEAVRALVADPELANDLGANGRARVRRLYDVVNYADQVRSLTRQVLDERRSPSP